MSNKKKPSRPPRWRDVLKIHPACLLFPELPEDELLALGEDILAHGLQTPIALIVVDGENFLVDGRSRLDAAEMAGCVLEFEMDPGDVPHMSIDGKISLFDWLDEDTDIDAFVFSANFHRRHLTAEGKREAIAQRLKANPDLSDRQIAKMVKVDNKTVAKVRREQEAREEIPHVAARTDTKGRQQPARKPAERKLMPSASERAVALGAAKEMAHEFLDTRNDIGPASGGEVERLHARIAELEDINRRLETKVIGLESEVAELRARLPQDDDIPPFQQRH
jgi:hypothetical protein